VPAQALLFAGMGRRHPLKTGNVEGWPAWNKPRCHSRPAPALSISELPSAAMKVIFPPGVELTTSRRADDQNCPLGR